MRAIILFLLTLLWANGVGAQRLDVISRLTWPDYNINIYNAPLHLPSGRVLVSLIRDSLYRHGITICQDEGYYSCTCYRGYRNRFVAVINPNGDTSHTVRSPFHFYGLIGGRQVGDVVHAWVLGAEPDSCWGGFYLKATYGLRTLDTNGNVIDSVSILNTFNHNQYSHFLASSFDNYGVTMFGYDLIERNNLAVLRYGYDGQIRLFSLIPFPRGFATLHAFADTAGGYYLPGISGDYNAVARIDSSSNLRSLIEFFPDFPARTITATATAPMADGGYAYSYIRNPGGIGHDTSLVIAQDGRGRRRFKYVFTGGVRDIVPLDDNRLLVYRRLDYDTIIPSTPGRDTRRTHQAVILDTLGQVVWTQQLLPKADGDYNDLADGSFTTFLAPDGTSSFYTNVVRRLPPNYRNEYAYLYGHISGVRRYDPSATKPAFKPGQLSLYPNPASTQLSIGGLARAGQAVISSSSGQVVRRQAVGPGQTVPVGDLPAGLYYIKLDDGRAGRFAVAR